MWIYDTVPYINALSCPTHPCVHLAPYTPSLLQQIRLNEHSPQRRCQSLGLLCGRFVEVYGRNQHLKDKTDGGKLSSSTSTTSGTAGDGPEGMIELDRAAEELGVVRRRIYDVINILESLCVVTRARKNTYRCGRTVVWSHLLF